MLLAVDTDPAHELAEVLGLAEVAVDGGEAHVGDLVEAGEGFHHQLADHVAGTLGLAGALELAHDRVDDALDALGLHRPLADRDVDRARELVAVEGLALSVLLDHGELAQLHALEGGEARRAIGTEAPASDRRAVLGRARILHLGILAAAERTAHASLLLILLFLPLPALPKVPDRPGSARKTRP